MSSIATKVGIPTASEARAPGRLRTLAPALMAMAGFCFVWLFSLSRSLLDPIGYDQALYQYMAERIIAGQTLYVDVWDQNAPGIVAIHWLATTIVGDTPVAHRVFDAGWQFLTLMGLVVLAARDGRNWMVGWLAAAMYALAYYGMGYVQTAQREGFAVLPLLLAAHAVLRAESPGLTAGSTFRRHVFAGAMGLLVFAIKPPLGLAFGVLWLRAAAIARARRREGTTAYAGLAGLTVGFLISAAVGAALLWFMGSLDGCWGVLTRRDMPGYIMGPRLIQALLPNLLLGTGLLGMMIGLLALGRRLTERREGETAGAVRTTIHPTLVAASMSSTSVSSVPASPRPRVSASLSQRSNTHWEYLRTFAVGLIVLGLLMTAARWAAWRELLIMLAGLWLPAIGAMIICFWRGRSEAWRICLLLLVAMVGAVIIQGQYFLYHCTPVFAFAAYLSAEEVMERIRRFPRATRAARAWTGTCLAAVAYLVAGYWWPTMTIASSRLNLLADRTLSEHYTAITRHKRSCPTYATTAKVAQRVRELTNENDPIACLFHDMRIYYFSKRPPVYRLLPVQPIFQHIFADYMQAIRQRRPKAVVARIPESLRGDTDLPAIESAVFEEAETYFGSTGRVIRELYHITDLIDDVCILQPSPAMSGH